MTRTLEQKRRSSIRKHSLESDRVIVETKSLRKNEKYEVMLDSVGSNISYKSDSTIVGKIFFFICLAIPIVLTIVSWTGSHFDSGTLIFNYVLWFSFALVNYLTPSQDDVFLIGGQMSLVFYRTIPNEKEVLEYINEIIVASKVYIREKYAKIDPDIPRDMFCTRLLMLKEREIITDAEYQEMKSEYDLKKLM